MVMHLVSPDPISQKLGILEVQDGGSSHLEKSKNHDNLATD